MIDLNTPDRIWSPDNIQRIILSYTYIYMNFNNCTIKYWYIGIDCGFPWPKIYLIPSVTKNTLRMWFVVISQTKNTEKCLKLYDTAIPDT